MEKIHHTSGGPDSFWGHGVHRNTGDGPRFPMIGKMTAILLTGSFFAMMFVDQLAAIVVKMMGMD
ncbi:MAG: hypothetical protein ACR2RE_12995 [Geminicoccaceae bacterium]